MANPGHRAQLQGPFLPVQVVTLTVTHLDLLLLLRGIWPASASPGLTVAGVLETD